MTHKRYRIPKATHGSQDWLNQRYQDEHGNRRISASAAAAIYGVHPFVPADVYAAELLSGVAPTPQPPSKAMDRGNRMEGMIIEWAGDLLGVTFTTPEELFCYDNDNGCHLIATLDGWNEDNKHILEVKTTTRDWRGELPDYWKIQGVQQAICADAQRVTWAVFDPSLDLHLYEQTITTDEIEEHIAAAEKWLSAIELGITPEGVQYSYETISTRYQQTVEEAAELPQQASDLLAQLRHVKSELTSYKALEDRLKADLCQLIGPSQTAILNGEVVATWKPFMRDYFDVKRFQAEQPTLASQYTKKVQSRTLRLKGEK
jgi:predicted phage-related endonuclease